MSLTRYLLVIIHAMLALAWAGCATAGAVALTQAWTSVDPVMVIICGAISTLSGATTLAIRVNGIIMADPSKPVVKPWLLAISHMLGSWLAGIVAVLGARINHSEVETMMMMVLLMSFVGAAGIEKVAERYLPSIRPPTPVKE